MIPGFGGRAGAAVLLLLVLASPPREAPAAPVADVYSATVPATDVAPGNTGAAFAEALRRVIVKASGRAAAGGDPQVLAAFGDPASLVQQYRRDAAGNFWAQFDPVAVRRGLVAAGLPVWGEDRPVTVIWLAYDDGNGDRDIVASGATDGTTGARLRQDLLGAAAARAVPVLLPLRDSAELSAVSVADVWGDFTDPVREASRRYQADAVLIGRARLFPPGMTDVRWTLLVAGERLEWRGSVADGPQGLADRLAERLAVAGDGTQARIALTVSGIDSLADYGRVLFYLRGLEVVQSADVRGASGNSMDFDLRLRGDSDRLQRVLAVRRVIEPEPGSVAGPGLRYRLRPAP